MDSNVLRERERVGDIFLQSSIRLKAHPACGKVPSNPINRHGALPGAGRLSEGGLGGCG